MLSSKMFAVLCFFCFCTSSALGSTEWQQNTVPEYQVNQDVSTTYGMKNLVHRTNVQNVQTVNPLTQTVPVVTEQYNKYQQQVPEWVVTQNVPAPVTPYTSFTPYVKNTTYRTTSYPNVYNQVMDDVQRKMSESRPYYNVITSSPEMMSQMQMQNEYCGVTSFPEMMMQMHNEIRVRAGLQKVQWSKELEVYARRSTMTEGVPECKVQETPKILRQQVGRFQNVGENVYTTLGPMTVHKVVDAMRSWVSGMECYRYGPVGEQCTLKHTPECKQSLKSVEQFVQVMAAPVTHMACAVHRCSTCMNSENCEQGHIVTCNYGSVVAPHAGNVQGVLPFDVSVAQTLQVPKCFSSLTTGEETATRNVLNLLKECLDNVEVKYKVQMNRQIQNEEVMSNVPTSVYQLKRLLRRGYYNTPFTTQYNSVNGIYNQVPLMNEYDMTLRTPWSNMQVPQSIYDVTPVTQQIYGDDMPYVQYPMDNMSQFPVNQLPVNQFPVNQLPVNQFPLYQYPVSPLQVGQYPTMNQYLINKYRNQIDESETPYFQYSTSPLGVVYPTSPYFRSMYPTVYSDSMGVRMMRNQENNQNNQMIKNQMMKQGEYIIKDNEIVTPNTPVEVVVQ